MFFYRLGHSPKISIAEISNLERNLTSKDPKYDVSEKYLISPTKIDIKIMGGSSYAGEIWGWLESEAFPDSTNQQDQDDSNSKLDQSWINKIKQILDQKVAADGLPKQLGISVPIKLAKKIIPTLRQYGAKKVNLLIDEEPNFGHLKGYPWIIISEFTANLNNTTKQSNSRKYFIGVINQVAPQDLYKFLDLRSPAGNMKRGLMNLKLAKSMLSLTSGSAIDYIWDPFCGQGGILLVNQVFEERPVIGTDLERQAVKFTKENIAWLETKALDQISSEFNWSLPQNQVLHIERMDAAKLAEASRESNMAKIIRKIEPKFDWSRTAIVTEGTLGPIYDRRLPSSTDELVANLNQITQLWKQVLDQANQLGIPELIFTLPFYRLPNENSIRIDPEQLTGLGYEIVDLNFQNAENQPWLDYFRPKTMVGHMILKMIKA
ncbi:MAG: hypothetical protein OHK0017_06660 [Patescibacteria group bacterium]